MTETTTKKRNLDYIKDACSVISAIAGIVLLVFKFQVNLSLNEINSLLFILGGAIFLLLIYLIYYYVKLLISSVINNSSILANLIKFIISLIGMGIITYFLINRSYFFITYFYLILIYLPILTVFFCILLYLIIKKTKLRKLRSLWKKVLIIISIIVSFSLPFFLGASYPQTNPRVEVSPKPMEISYERGNQVQEIQEITVYLKSIEANARNVNIYIQAPPDFYYWVDGIQNDTKTINFLKYDEINQFLLEIQPSISVGNGTYNIEIHWSYESDLGNIYYKSLNLKVFIGPRPSYMPEVQLYIILIVLVIGLLIISITLIKRKKLKKNTEKKNFKED